MSFWPTSDNDRSSHEPWSKLLSKAVDIGVMYGVAFEEFNVNHRNVDMDVQ